MIDQFSSLPERLLTTSEAATLVGLSPNHLEKLRVRGGGPSYIKLGRQVRYEPQSIADWISSARRSSTSDVGPG